MELINSNSEIIKDFFQSVDRMLLDGISRLAKENKAYLNGEKFLSNKDVAKCLKVSIRTLQEWRDTGVRKDYLPSKRHRTTFTSLL